MKNNNDRKLKWYNTNKIVMQENNVDTFIFFGWLSTLIELARLVVMFPICFDASRSNIIWNWYYLKLISQRLNSLHLSRTPANEDAPRNPWIPHMFEHVCFNHTPWWNKAIINYIIDHARTRPADGRCAHWDATTTAMKAIESGLSRPRTETVLFTIRRCVHNIINYIIDHARTRTAYGRCAHWAATTTAIKAIEGGLSRPRTVTLLLTTLNASSTPRI